MRFLCLLVAVAQLQLGSTDPLFSEHDDNCPEMSGKTQWQQLMEFWRSHMAKEVWRSDVELIEQAVTLNLYNIAWVTKPDPSKVEFVITHQLIDLEEEEKLVKIIITENNDHKLTQGGSTFRTDVTSRVSKANCPFRDYFNGTYLICCSIVNQYSTIKISHQHFNFTAYELFLGAADYVTTDPRRINKVIWEKVIGLPGEIDTIDNSKHECSVTTTFKRDGHWMYVQDKYWRWVVNGCSFAFTPLDKIRQCFTEKFGDHFMAIGESHVRDVFFYMARTLDDTFSHMERLNYDLRWQLFWFRWETNFFVLEKHLKMMFMDTGSGRNAPPLIIINVGEWPIISRPIGDYLLSMTNIINILTSLKRYGTTVIWQEMIAVKNIAATNRPSNDLISALNYFICTRLEAEGIPCVPYWKFSMPCAEELLCPGKTSAMCFSEGYLNVIPPGHLAAQYIFRYLCTK